MPDLYGSDLAANSRKVTPSDQMGTRHLAYLVVVASGLGTNYEDSNSVYSQVVRFIAQNCELYSAGMPNGDYATIIVNADSMPETTNPDHPSRINDGVSRNTYLEDVLYNSGIEVVVWNAKINGSNLVWDDC